MTDLNVQLRHEESTGNPDDAVVVAARGDYSTESMIGVSADDALDGTDKDQKEFIESLFRRGHIGPAEHPQAFFAIEGMSIACERQLTRHRLFSFDIQSLRYTEPEEADVVIPSTMDDMDVQETIGDPVVYYQHAAQQSFDSYRALVEKGVPAEEARMILPLGTQINGTMSANLRSFFHLIDMRVAGDAQAEIRELAKMVMEELEDWAPICMEVYKKRVKGSSKKAP